MTDPFSILLEELGKVFHMSLHPDKLGACSLSIPPHPILVLEPDESREFLYLFSKIGEIAPGKFRENVLLEALKTNGYPDPRPAILGYIGSHNLLAAHLKFPISFLDGERLASLIGDFLEMTDAWKTALDQGKSGPDTSPPSLPSPMLGFRP